MNIDGQTEWEVVDEVDGDAVLIDRKRVKFPAKSHARAVAKHLGVTQGLICLPGTPSVNYEDSDMPLYFRQSRYFYYLTGVNHPNCIVTYNIKQDALYVWIPPPNTGRSRIYNGNNPSKEEIKAIADFDLVALNTQFQDYITFFTSRKEGPIYVLHEYQAPISRNIPNSRDDPSIHVKPRVDFTLLKPAMNASRVIKSPYEIAQIRKANAITALAHTAVLRSLLTLTNEAEIEAIFTATCIASQAKSQAYGIIAGSGRNASTLHYIANNEPLKGRQLVCLDAGCEWGNYASDVTRTFPINGKWTKEGRAIYRVVERMQEECIRMVKPGEDYRRIQLHAHRVLVEELLKLGILCGGGLEEVLKSGVSTAFLPHGLGHYMGLEVHDVGDGGNLLSLSGIPKYAEPAEVKAAFHEMLNKPKKNPSILVEGHVITIEPGIYFNTFGLQEIYLPDPAYSKYINEKVLDKYYDVGGVRIEDDILVTGDGYENLTTTPKGEEALRIILGEDDGKKEGKKGCIW